MKRITLLHAFVVQNNHIKDFFRIMRISLFLLFVGVCQVMAEEADAQNAKIKISQSELTIKQLVKEIEAQTDYLVVYRDQDVDVNRTVSFQKKSASVSDYLKQVSESAGIEYQFENNYITLVSKENVVTQDGKIITGKIVDENGEPIIGANVVEKGTSNGTMTDMNGNFSLKMTKGNIVHISYIGCLPYEMEITNQTQLNVVLKEDTQVLDEVVVVGYGTQKKANLTGAVAQVGNKLVENRSVTNIGQALQGQVANLNITIGSGDPGTGATYNIRGMNSLSGGEPLVIIDGVPDGDLNTLNPNDIESVSVLKDAASAAIYGARAAYGVILVKTKMGKKNSKINLMVEQSRVISLYVYRTR